VTLRAGACFTITDLLTYNWKEILRMAPNRNPNHSDRHRKDEFPLGANAPEEQEPQAEPEEETATREANSPGPEPTANGATTGPDPFAPASLRLPPEGTAALGVRKALLSVPVRKPAKEWFVRAHPAEDYRLQTQVIELKEDRETYLVAQSLWAALAAEATLRRKLLVTAINRQGTLFVWPLNLPQQDGRIDEWSRTALEALEMATREWVRLTADMALGAYDVHAAMASDSLPPPEWPTTPFREVLRIAFRQRYIDSPDHPVLRRLRGEV
jgi:hypothetical protein